LRLTSKQILLMKAICIAQRPDLDEILETLEYETTKQSLQFSIRALMRRGLIERSEIECRRGRNRRIITLTKLGYSIYSASV
jgi:hypothetical protein